MNFSLRKKSWKDCCSWRAKKREFQAGAAGKLSGVMQDGKIVVNEQIYGLLSDPKKLEMLLNSGIVGRLLKELGRQKES